MKKIEQILIALAIIGIIILIPKTFTGKVTLEDKYSYTKAICDENNYCEDYVIECSGSSLARLTPTGFALQQEENWKDTRENENFCD
ncbi:hypothetical protein GW932_03630 [archaeon]|nr:hypothetical protein [archaeon]